MPLSAHLEGMTDSTRSLTLADFRAADTAWSALPGGTQKDLFAQALAQLDAANRKLDRAAVMAEGLLALVTGS